MTAERAGLRSARPQRFVIHRRTGDATKIDEKVPTMMPNVITSANGLITSPAKNDSTNAVASVVPPVRIVRGSVLTPISLWRAIGRHQQLQSVSLVV